MKGWKMYSQIHQLKESGFKKAQIAKELGINVKTVRKYWELLPDEYYVKLVNSQQRQKYLEKYENVIIGWLTEHPDMSYTTGLRRLSPKHTKERTALSDIM